MNISTKTLFYINIRFLFDNFYLKIENYKKKKIKKFRVDNEKITFSN